VKQIKRSLVLMLVLFTLVQLALTADGRPRLMIRQSNISSGELSKTYSYAECNSDCTTPPSGSSP
jgi:hypothetical protein